VTPAMASRRPSTLQPTAVPYHNQAGQWLRAREFVVVEYLGNRASFRLNEIIRGLSPVDCDLWTRAEEAFPKMQVISKMVVIHTSVVTLRFIIGRKE
jgi:hypothetical protein